MLAVQPVADGDGMAAGVSAPPAPTLTRSGTVQLAGEPPADFRRAGATDAAAHGDDNSAPGAIESPDTIKPGNAAHDAQPADDGGLR